MGVLDPGVSRPPEAKPAEEIAGPLGFCAKDTPAGSVGKRLVLSIFPDIHRCIREMYS